MIWWLCSHLLNKIVLPKGSGKCLLYGLSKGGYSDDISSQVTMEDLFRDRIE